MSKKLPTDKAEVLFPQASFTLNGETIQIKKFPFRDLRKVSRILSIYQNSLIVAIEQSSPMLGLSMALGEEGQQPIDHIEEIIQIATGKEPGWADDVDYDQVVLLFAEILRVNWDFFTILKAIVVPAVQGQPPTGDGPTTD